MDFNIQPLDLSVDSRFFDLLTSSYYRLVGKPLVEVGRGAQWLYDDANFVVVAHNTDADPRFIYANHAAQICFGYSWDEFMAMPSHLTAVTTRLDTRFLKPAALGAIIATARLLHQDERSAEVIAELTDSEGKIVATARAELRVRERKNRA